MKQGKNIVRSSTLLKGLLFLCFFVGSISFVHAQDADDAPQSGDPNLEHPTTKAQKALAKKQKQRAKEAKKAEKALLKQHMKDQSPDVRKRMKADAKEAKRNNEHKKEPFYMKWFKKKGT
jgi:hypothetical protein